MSSYDGCCRHGWIDATHGSRCPDCAEIKMLRDQRNAWKEVAEHQYGLLRVALYGDAESNYPVEGALDAWAAGRHPVLVPKATVSRAHGKD